MENYIKEVLENAGWYYGRKIDVDYMIEELEREGFVIKNHRIIELFEEFWNLNIEYKTPDGSFSSIRLNTEVACGIEKKIVDQISNMINDELIPVGAMHEDTALLLISNSGLFYLAADEKFYKIGDDFFEALSTIINQKDVTKFSF